MADKKVTQLTASTVATKDDLLLIIDDPLGSRIIASGTTSLGANNFTLTSNTQSILTRGVSINSTLADSDTKIASDNQTNMFYVDASADKIGIMTDAPTEALDINSDAIRIRTTQTPASSNNTAVGWGVGTISWDASYLYIAVDASTIKRVALSSF